MGMILIDPFLSLANIIWAMTLIVVIWRFLGGVEKSSPTLHNQEDPNTPRHKTGIYWYLLFSLFVLLTAHSLVIDYSHFSNKTVITNALPDNHFYYFDNKWRILSISGYIMQMFGIFFIQLLGLCTVCLLWIIPHSAYQNKLIYWGLWVQSVGILVRCLIFYSAHLPIHWVQFIEMIATLLLLLFLPLLTLIFFRFKQLSVLKRTPHA